MSAADQKLRAFVDRILRLKDEQDSLGGDVKDVYAELKADGYDKTAVGALVSELRKKGKDAAKFEESSAILDLYREAYDKASHTHAPARTREIVEEFPATNTGESDAKSADAAVQEPDLIGAGEHHEEPATNEEVRIGRKIADSPAPRNGDGTDSLAARESEKVAAPIRPHCLNRETCGGVGFKHCYSCSKAMGLSRESEGA